MNSLKMSVDAEMCHCGNLCVIKYAQCSAEKLVNK